MSTGIFITFEGLDGSGKTTQVHSVDQYLRNKQLRTVVTREPGGTPLAEKIRNLVLSPDHMEMSERCEVLLYEASRAQHVTEKILPALQQGLIVLCDRFVDATLAYQGFGRGIDTELLSLINSFATCDVVPDKTFILDIGVSCALDRIKRMNKTLDRLETNAPDFYERIRQGYLFLAQKHPDRICVINAERNREEIFEDIKNEINNILAKLYRT